MLTLHLELFSEWKFVVRDERGLLNIGKSNSPKSREKQRNQMIAVLCSVQRELRGLCSGGSPTE